MTTFHKFNKELTTPCYNALIGWFKFAVGATGAVGTISQLKGNMISSITREDVGEYTVQLTHPYPEALINLRASINRAAVGDADVRVDYDAASYSKTAGTFTLFCSGHTAADNTAQVAADPTASSELHVEYVFAGRKHSADV